MKSNQVASAWELCGNGTLKSQRVLPSTGKSKRMLCRIIKRKGKMRHDSVVQFSNHWPWLHLACVRQQAWGEGWMGPSCCGGQNRLREVRCLSRTLSCLPTRIDHKQKLEFGCHLCIHCLNELVTCYLCLEFPILANKDSSSQCYRMTPYLSD